MNCVAHQSPGLWRHPDDRGHDYTDVHAWVRLARTLEDAMKGADVFLDEPSVTATEV